MREVECREIVGTIEIVTQYEQLDILCISCDGRSYHWSVEPGTAVVGQEVVVYVNRSGFPVMVHVNGTRTTG